MRFIEMHDGSIIAVEDNAIHRLDNPSGVVTTYPIKPLPCPCGSGKNEGEDCGCVYSKGP